MKDTMKITLTTEQVLEFIILGINNKQYEAAKKIAEQTLDEIRKYKNDTNIDT